MEDKGLILLADDESDIREIVGYNLIREGYRVIEAKDGDQALALAQQQFPDLLVLDVMMPYKTGIEVCKRLRSQQAFKNTIIVLLTALSDEYTHIHGLEIGADDFISKPISPKILVSRINALFRRVQKDNGQPVITMSNMIIDPIKFVVIIEGQEISLVKKEFELLYLLASQAGRVFPRQEILNTIWGTEVIVGDRTIDVHVRKIRQKLNNNCIATVKGVGYKFQ